VRGLPRFDGRSAFSTWAYRVATNACLDELRRRRRRPTPVDAEAGFAGEAWSGDEGGPVDGAIGVTGGGAPGVGDTVADRVTIDDALAELRPELRAAVVLRDLLGLDYAQIAEVLDVPAGTVRSRISRGRAALAARIGNPTADRDVRTEAP
jgi:RNA polymerase sigma-70 factor (ECF subfamily)